MTMTLSLPKEKAVEMQSQCQEILGKVKVAVRKLTKLNRTLSSTTITVLPAPLENRQLRSLQIQEFIQHKSFEGEVRLSCKAREKLLWWKENLFPQR